MERVQAQAFEDFRDRVPILIHRGTICSSFSLRFTIVICYSTEIPSTYNHRLKRTGYPVRSGVLKLEIG